MRNVARPSGNQQSQIKIFDWSLTFSCKIKQILLHFRRRRHHLLAHPSRLEARYNDIQMKEILI